MNSHRFSFAGVTLEARPSGTLWWPGTATLVVSDLHLGKSERIARRRGTILPPYEDRDTLARLGAELSATGARRVISLGDSFDDSQAAHALAPEIAAGLAQLATGRDWYWIEGNHDPEPVPHAGRCMPVWREDGLTFRHIADPAESGEISGHYHPKARVSLRAGSVTRPAFLIDATRMILPAFGTYTGGLHCHEPALADLMAEDALALLTGTRVIAVQMPRMAPPDQLSPAPPRRFG